MPDARTPQPHPDAALAPSPPPTKIRTARLIAAFAGALGFLLAILTPLLPVEQDAASIEWPQAGTVDVEAPLVSYAPAKFDATIPCAGLTESGVLLSTVPDKSGAAAREGLLAQVSDGRVRVILRDNPLLDEPVDRLNCQTIAVTSTAARTTLDAGTIHAEVGRDIRPIVVGLFTDRTALDGFHARVDIDSRFSSTPSALKIFAIVAAILATLVALIALHVLDGVDGRRARRFLPQAWWRITLVDVFVVGTLGLWHLVGANTSDDGYILNMARASENAGYMANYYRWFGVPEAPFGWYYDVLAWMTQFSTASPWMRLPALLAAILCWMVISREVLPRLGHGARRTRSQNWLRNNSIAVWTAGLVFLAFWLPYNNGLRPEPVIAFGALLTWCSIERAIATGRLLPAAIAVLIAAFSLAAGPTGLICVAALLAGARPVLALIVKRAHGWVSLIAMLAPGFAAGVLVLVVVFADQTLATVRESTRVRDSVGPSVEWFDERVRYDALLTISPDGSLARRFGVFVMFLCLVVCVLVLLRKGGRIPGTSRGPSARILGIVFTAPLLMMFTPTKWTHHFGVYAGLAGSLAALAAVAVSAETIRSRRNRTLFAAGVTFLLAFAFTSSNGWWYVSSFGVPFFDKPPSVAGVGVASLLMVATVLLLLLAAWQHLREPYTTPTGRDPRIAFAPLTIAAAFVVLVEVASLTKAAVWQYPAYSIGKANVQALLGKPCGLADEVLVETDANQGLLRPAGGETVAENFSPEGVAEDLTADSEDTSIGGANTVSREATKTTATTGAGTGAKQLAFGLEAPVLGSYQQGAQRQARVTTQWYGLDRRPQDKILVVTAAGQIRNVDADGVVSYGQDLRIEYGRDGAPLGAVTPYDIGPAPSWRNLRIPLSAIPPEADQVRIVAVDNDITQRQWLAFTPPRIPRLQTLQDVVGRTTPTLLDWHVGLAYPCQRPFDHHNGVAEVPKFRVLPDRGGQDAANKWQDNIGGGPLGWIPLLLEAQTMPGYLNDDWRRDWGSIERLTPWQSGAPAQVDVTTVSRSGLWHTDPIREKG